MRIAKIKSTIILLLAGILLSQCTKFDTTTIGTDLIPGTDGISTFDTTLKVIANNFDDIDNCDSVGRGDFLASGVIANNPFFGSARAEMYFEMKPVTFPIAIPEHDDGGLSIDSVVMVLDYVGSYGDSSITQKLNVFDLSQNLDPAVHYKTCESIPAGTRLFGSAVYRPMDLRDSVHTLDGDAANQLRIRLSDDLGEDIVNNASELTSDSLFSEFFKGFAVLPDETEGGEALNYFNLSGENSGLRIYTTSVKDSKQDTTVIFLQFNSSSSQANYISRDRMTSEITNYTGEQPEGDSLLFVETGPSGSYVQLKIPDLGDFPNAAISLAELTIEQVYDPAAITFDAPSLLFIDVKDSTGRYIPIPCDFSSAELSAGFTRLGGRPIKGVDDEGHDIVRYKFSIPRYVQSVLTGRSKDAVIRLRAPFYIEMTGPSYIDNCGQPIQFNAFPANPLARGGVKLNGTNSLPGSVKLHIVYSTL